jgi:formylglycine-generating enzyme required for sulfatase activity
MPMMQYQKIRSFNLVFIFLFVFSGITVLGMPSSVVYGQAVPGTASSGIEGPAKAGISNRSGRIHIIPSIGYEMIYVSPGTFMMGSPSNEKGRYGDETQHQVILTKGFYMGITEVTQGQWKKIMGNNPSHFKKCGDDCPVEQISWRTCQEFIILLNKKEKTRKYRLPTEAEWEYACRAGSTLAFANGDITRTGCGQDPNLNKIGWYCGNSGEKIQPVAKKIPNTWGFYDMHGNVWEWCQDWYGQYKTWQVVDPKGPSSGDSRVFRGGGWGLNARTCRSAFRDKYNPTLKCRHLGFRLVREAEGHKTSQ